MAGRRALGGRFYPGSLSRRRGRAAVCQRNAAHIRRLGCLLGFRVIGASGEPRLVKKGDVT